MNTIKMNDYACMAAGIAPKKVWTVRDIAGQRQYDAPDKKEAERWLMMTRKNAPETSAYHSCRIVEEDSYPDLDRNDQLATAALRDFIVRRQLTAQIIVQPNLIAITMNGDWICTGQTVGSAVIQFMCWVCLNGLIMSCANERLQKETES